MAKKDLLKKAAGREVQKALGKSGEDTQASSESKSSEEQLEVEKKEADTVEKKENNSYSGSEKQLPKKDHLYSISTSMRIEDYNRPTKESGSKKPLFTILFILLLGAAVWYFWPQSHAIYMDRNKLTTDRISHMSAGQAYDFELGQDFFVYYRKGGWTTPKVIHLRIYKLDGGKEEYHSLTRTVRSNIKKFQTYYDDSFFDSPGTYVIEFRDEDENLLVSKNFKIH